MAQPLRPTTGADLTYEGSEKTFYPTNWDAERIEAIGNKQTNAGTYTATFTPKEGYTWSDGGTDPVSVDWKIVPKDLEESDLVFEDLAQTYKGRSLEATIKLDDGTYSDNLTFTSTYSMDAAQTSGSPAINVGLYTIFVSTAGNQNFKPCTDLKITGQSFSIDCADLALTMITQSYGTAIDPRTYDGFTHYLSLEFTAPYDEAPLKWTFLYRMTGGTLTTLTATGTSATFEVPVKHAISSESEWSVTAAPVGIGLPNYNVLNSTNETKLSAYIVPYQITPTSSECVESYNGNPHVFSVSYSLLGDDIGKEGTLIKVKYGASAASVTGGVETVEQIYATDGAKTFWYQLAYDDTQPEAAYGDYTFADPQSQYIVVMKRQLTGIASLDGQVLDGTSKTVQYDSQQHAFVFTPGSLQMRDEATASYELNGATYDADGLKAQLVNVGEYTVRAKVSAKTGQLYSNSYSDCTQTFTVKITEATPSVGNLTVTYPTDAVLVSADKRQCSYDGTAKVTTAVWTPANASITVTVKAYIGENPIAGDPVNAGTYQLYAEVASTDDNYKSTTGKGLSLGTLVIGQAAPTATDLDIDCPAPAIPGVDGWTYTYDGNYIKPTASWSDADRTKIKVTVVCYEVVGTDEVRTTSDPRDVGSYKVYAEVTSTDPDYAGTSGKGILMGTLVIGQATPAFADLVVKYPSGVAASSAHVESSKYDRNAKEAGATWRLAGNDSSKITIQYRNDAGVLLTDVPRNAGTYKAYAQVSGARNYQDTTDDGIFLGTIQIDKADPSAGDIQVTYPDGVEFGPDGNPTASYDGGSKAPDVSWRGTGGENVDLEVKYYDENGDPIDGEPTQSGTYSIYVKVTSTDPNYNSTPDDGKGVLVGTLVIEDAAVTITSFQSDMVMEGSRMTMRVTLRSVGQLTADPVVRYGNAVLALTSGGISDLGNGMYEAVVYYDTSDGTVPAGIFRTVTVQYPGDEGHKESAAKDYKVCIRTEGTIVIPEEGGDAPTDPNKKTDVITPTGGMEIEVDDGGTGNTPTIHIHTWDAGEDEKVPGADKTVIIETDGYTTGPDGEKIPAQYEIIHTIYVDVPDGKKPVVKLYDENGDLVRTPEILSYTSDSVTFRTEAEGFEHLRVAVTFETVWIPSTDTDANGSGDEEAGASGSNGSGSERHDGNDDGIFGKTTAAGACIVAILLLLVAYMIVRSRTEAD